MTGTAGMIGLVLKAQPFSRLFPVENTEDTNNRGTLSRRTCLKKRQDESSVHLKILKNRT